MSTKKETEGKNFLHLNKRRKSKELDKKNLEQGKHLLETSNNEAENNNTSNNNNTLSILNNTPISIRQSEMELSSLKGESINSSNNIDDLPIERENQNEIGSFKRTDDIKGNMIIFYKKNKDPLFVIGPHCKYNNI